MVHAKEVLLDQLGACHNDPSWFPTILEALQGLTLEQAVWRENENTHSIWEIVQHLTFWNKRWLERFKNEGSYLKSDNESTFNIEQIEITEHRWKLAVDELDSVLSQWRSVLDNYSESKVESEIPNFSVVAPWWAAISNLNIHNAYHIGQIIYIRKLSNNWTNKY